MNSAWIWDFYSSQRSGGSDKTDKEWETYLNYDVVNNMPELRNDAIGNYQGMAYSCLSRNRDNNGDGKVDRNEVRWYLAAINQLAGMWVGNESLSINARLYRPAEGQWRSHIVSSSGKRVSWAEEGGGATDYTWDFDYGNRFIWHTVGEAAAGESVRCLRNIGTYEEGGVLKDISNAPYDTEIDEYFTCESTDGGDSYTFFFDRLNPKSMRQLSEGELPYHDQFNIMNCVYMKFETQRRSENVGDTEEDDFRKINTINNPDKNKYPKNKDINKEVTALGYNPYCPPGYRFPNQSEMLLMSLYLPVEYFILDKDGNAYGGLYMPTRTYYDRGYYGGITSNMPAEDITREQEKIGWAYNTSSGNRKANNAKNLDMKRSRCVRDVEMTGYIEGGILMDTPRICPGDWIPVTLSFFSSGAAFVSGSLKLCYTDGGGTYHERDIPLDKTPTGMEYVVDQKVTIPSLASLEMTESDLDTDLKNMKFKITMRNAATSKSFELPVTMCSHMIGCSVSLPAVSDPDKGMPVHVEIGSRTIRSKLSSLVLHWKASDGSWQEKQLVPDNSVNSYSQDCYLKDIIGADSWATEANRYKEYQFYVTASCDDGTHYVSETISQQLFRLNYTPNPVPENGWTNISQCNATWSDAVAGLNFAAGDYIEVDMDLTNCRYKYLTGTAATDLGQDNLIQFSKDNIGNIPSSDGTNHIKNSLIWYYPSVQNLVNSDDPAAWGWIRSRIHAGKWSAYTPDEGVLTRMNLILDKDGLIRDGTRWTANPGDWNSRVKAALVGSSTVYIGSVEGVHHSRATYNYVRAVRVPATPGATPVPRP